MYETRKQKYKRLHSYITRCPINEAIRLKLAHCGRWMHDGMKIQDLSNYIGASTIVLSRWATGKTTIPKEYHPKIETLFKEKSKRGFDNNSL